MLPRGVGPVANSALIPCSGVKGGGPSNHLQVDKDRRVAAIRCGRQFGLTTCKAQSSPEPHVFRIGDIQGRIVKQLQVRRGGKSPAPPEETLVGNGVPAMKRSFLGIATPSVALMTGAALILINAAQAPRSQEVVSKGPLPQSRSFPAPTNLKVLKKEMTGEQIHFLMEDWTASLGAQCGSCHSEDLENIGPDGRPLLKFESDSKPMKAVARTMFTMTEEINTKYVARIDNSGVPLTCGTCHRGRLEPEPFAPAASTEVTSPQATSNDGPQSSGKNSGR